MTMKKQIIYMVCATALLSICYIYKAYDSPDTIESGKIYAERVHEYDATFLLLVQVWTIERREAGKKYVEKSSSRSDNV